MKKAQVWLIHRAFALRLAPVGVASRGIKDTNSSTVTASYSGRFHGEKLKAEFLALLNSTK